MNQSTSFAQVATNQFDYLSSALCANTPPCKKHSSSRKFLTLSISLRLLLVMFLTLTVTTNAWGADTWTLVTKISDLATGDKVVIVANSANFALSTIQNGNNRGQAAITKSQDKSTIETPSNSVQIITLEAGKTSGTFAFYTGNGYLYAASSSKNYLRTETTLSDNSSWTITITSAGVATIKAQGTNTRNWLRYNSNDDIFSCYSSGQGDVCIYKKEAAATKTLSSIAVSGQTTTYTVGDSFSFDGICTATYSDASTQTVTPTSVSTPDMSSAGTYTVTVSYTEGGVTRTDDYTITVSPAQGGGGSGSGECTWELVTDASTLKVDDEVIIAASDNDYAISTNQANNNRTATSITKNGNKLDNPSSSVQVLTLKAGSITGTWAFYTGSGYLYAASSSNNYLRTQTTNNDNGSFTITIVDNVATIVAQGTNTCNTMRYNPNNGNPVFACYASTSTTGSLPCIYKKVCATQTVVTLNPNGGTFTSTPDGWTKEGNKLTKEVDGSVTLPTPIHDGCYDFAGWYDEQTDGNKIGDEYEPEEDIELFAHWTESTTSFIAMIDDENIPTVEGIAIEIGLNEDGTGKDTDGVETTCGNNVYLFRTLVQGYKEVQWTVTIDGTQETIAVQNDGDVPYFVMPKADVLVSAELIECDEMDAPVVTATSTNNSITLSWDPITGAKEYNVFIFYDYGNSHQQDDADVVIDGTNYTFTNLDAEHTYTYFVQAQTEIGTCFTETMGEITTAPSTCTVTYDANGGEGTITDATKYTNGATVTVLGNFGKFTNKGCAFTGWNTKADGTGKAYKHDETFTITTNTTLYAQWCEAYWKLVTNADELENDTRIVIAAKDYNFALSTTQAASNRGQAEITKKYNTITFGSDVQTLSVVGLVNNNFALYSPGPLSIGYLYAASNSANQLKTKATPDNNCYWSIGISETVASIYVQGGNSHNQIKYNHQQSGQLFSCYESTNTTMSDVVIYKEVCKQDSYIVSATLTNANAANNNATTVLATAKELTLKYSAADGYLLPETITVQMGGVALSSTDDYTWDKETGELTITVIGFYGNIDVTIEAEEDPCYTFTMSEVTATSTTNLITLTWTEVAGATGYNVKLNEGDFTAATGLTHTFEGLSPKKPYTWEVQAVKDGANFHCEASKTGSTTTQKETFTVSWSVNGNLTSTESVVDGEKIKNYPSDPSAPSGCHEKVFVGWTNTPINTPTNETPAILYKQKSDVPAITETKTLHAVWADVIGGGETTKSLLNAEIKSFHQQGVTTSYSDLTVPSTDGDWSGLFCTANSNSVYTINLKKDLVNENRPYLKSSEFNNITKVSIIATHTSTKGNRTLYLCNAATNSPESNNIGTISIAKDNNSSQLCTLSSSATTLYLYVDNGIQIKTITLTTGGTTTTAYTTLCDECTPSTLTLETDNTTADLDINGEATITFSTTGGNGGEIVYAANPKAGVTWDNGTATFAKAGEYSITASQGKNGEYCPTTSNIVNVTITAIPHLYFVTEPANPIVFDPVECGGNTRGEDKKSVSVQAYNLAAAVTAQVTGPYKIARTSGATLNEYTTSLTLRNNIIDGKINGDDDVIYILSFPPAGSSEPTEGTLTFKTTNGNTLTVNLSTPTITCTPRTLTFNDRGIKTTQEYYAGTEVPEPATPTGVCGEYEFDGWALAKVESGSTTYAKVEFPYIMPANNQTVLYAVYRYTEGPTNQYELVTEIESGKDYVIAAYDEQNGDFALTNSESSTNGKFASVKVECDVNNIITTDNADIIWTVTGNDEDGYEFYNSAVQKYIEMYRYDGKSLLRLVDNCTNTFDVNIEMDENDKVYVDITSPEVDATYNVFSFYEQLFNVYKSCDYNIYFYEQTATSLYTTTPDCHPSVTLTSDGEVYVTATNGRGIMATTPLTLTTTDLAPNTEIAISSNSSDIYFSTERNTNFAMAQASQPKTLLTLTTNEGGELEKQLYIHYKPNADGDGTPAEVVVTADVSTHNPPFTAQKTIHVRNLPAKFVIATKAGATWYALPANMNDATNPAAVVIEVDETTMTATAPNTIPYTLYPVATINSVETDRYKEYGERLRFAAVNNGNKGLWANNSKEGTDINNYAAITAANSTAGAAYEWKVITTIVDGNWQYTLYSDQENNKNHLCYSMNQENPAWGTYASNEAQYQLYFLPIKAETTPFDYQVVEYYPNKVLIYTTTAFSSLTAKIAGEQVANVQYTSKDANQYEVTGLPLMENPAKALTLEFVVADATYTGIHTIPVMLSGGDHSISTLAIDKGIYNYTDLVVRDGATLTIDGDTKADNTFYDVTIYPTAKISVPEGKQLSVHRMTFLGGISEIYNGSTYTTNKYGIPQLSLMGTLGKTVTTMDYIMRVNLDQMYQVGVPYDVNLNEITYWDGSAIKLGDELYVSAYDGQARANLDMNKTWRWEVNFDEKVLKAGVGYTISAEPQVENDDYSILRMPMKNNIASGTTEASKQVPVIAYANQHSVQIADNHKGWNYLSNPYMTAISGGDVDSKILLGALQYNDGSWELVNTEYRYVTIPYNDGEDYYQQKFSKATLLPFKSFFLQIAENGDLSFDLASRKPAPARYLQQAADMREVEFEILLANATRSDNMGLLISEEYTPDYEINADLEKMIGSMSVYSIYNGYNLAYNAINPTNAQDWIPIGYSVPDVGEYTFSLDEDVDLESVEHIYLIDYETSEMTDLVEYEYTFQTSEKKNDARFAIQVRLSQKHDDTTTVLDNLNATDNKSSKFIYNEQLYILRNGNIYDATGQFVTTINK